MLINRKCPNCDALVSYHQYVFYRKPRKVKCRNCKMELIYKLPTKKIIGLILFGVFAAIPSGILLYYGVGILIFITVLIVTMIVTSYIEAV